MSWNLRQLFEGLVELPTTVDIDAVEITAGIECRADKVSAGTVYFAFAEYLRYNEWLEGKDDLNLAIANGAVAVVIDAAACSKDISVPVIQADDVRALCGRVAARYWGLEAENLPLIGITGTNGKTTTALLSHFVLHQCGISSGCLGTLGVFHNGWKVRESEYTTGLAVDTCRYLQELQKRGAKAAALEVSSHALALQRMSGLPLHVAVVTNVTRDHIDFHGTEAAYLQAKLAILQLLVADGIAVLNADDHNFANFAARWEGRTISYGIHNANAALRAENIEADAAETRFELDYCGQRFPVSSRLIGRFQVYNILAAVSVAIAMGAQPAHAAAAIAGFSPVPGRMESYQLPNGAHALIDFAHNPDGLRNLLENCAALRSRRLLLVFGCGGDRDRGKRPIMGRIGADYADRCWITSDNPRTESPQQIFEDILAGIPDDSAHKVEVEPDRRKAIKLAYANSQPGDLIVIAGKGHEAYMIFGHTKHPYSDKEEVLDLR